MGSSDIRIPIQFSSTFSSSTSNVSGGSNMIEQEVGDQSDADDDDYDDIEEGLAVNDEKLVQKVDTIVDILQNFGSNGPEAKLKLEQCDVPASSELVVEVLSRVRNDWAAAFTFFLWAGKQPGYTHSVREYHSMISILGKMRKFDTAWALIDEMRGGKTGPSLVTPQTLLIMIRKYCAVHDVGKAINTFYALKRFKFTIGIEEFQDLLCALCRYKNVEDAEHLLFCNEKVFPFNTKSFNIVLNGWCNMIVNLREAKRFWREMGRREIARDAVSYSSMISCYSKASNLNDVLKLFNQMKELGIAPDKKVYNAVIYALAKGKLVKEACNLLKTMEEKGFKPDVVTYNSLIKPLCKARRIDEARLAFDEMLQRGLSPSIRTYHAFFSILRTGEEVFELLGKMKKTGCPPTNDTYIMLIRKFCRWRQIENVFKLWNEMGENGLSPDRSSYIVLVHGLFLNGKLEEASKYYEEMKEKGFLPEPKTDEMLQAWVTSKQIAVPQKVDLKDNQVHHCHCPLIKNTSTSSNASVHERDFRKQPETRKVTREKGFSFWEH
ncbi:Pentatricopeptide repeat [Macleaya cordata]|uniref:Pentatricopeptide repeat n=1 Tax=Macleaya cordata TaxID=56857 RepID=A0A200Q0A1_MACCD|nr:Pentatricopeptide repeat [Macleaya cordata]